MPDCGRIEGFTIEEASAHWITTVVTHYSSVKSGVSGLVLDAFPQAAQADNDPGRRTFGEVRNSRVDVPKTAVDRTTLEHFLKLLHWSVTMSDDADESHALQVQLLPPSETETDEPEWPHTEMGRMVNQAKSYDLFGGDQAAAEKLGAFFVEWIRMHPRYGQAHVVLSPPAGNPNKRYDLPDLIAKQVADSLMMVHVRSRKTRDTAAQKGIEEGSQLRANVHGSMLVPADLSGRIALVVDDIYRSGQTVCELVRACREANAETVLALSATKTVKYCYGFTANRWRQVYEDAGNRDGKWAYD